MKEMNLNIQKPIKYNEKLDISSHQTKMDNLINGFGTMNSLLENHKVGFTNFPYIVKISPNQNYRNNMENGLLENIVKRCRLSHKKSNVYTDTLKCQFSPLSLAEVRKFNNIFLAKTEKQAFLRITGLYVNDFKICRGQFGNICQNFQGSCILIQQSRLWKLVLQMVSHTNMHLIPRQVIQILLLRLYLSPLRNSLVLSILFTVVCFLRFLLLIPLLNFESFCHHFGLLGGLIFKLFPSSCSFIFSFSLLLLDGFQKREEKCQLSMPPSSNQKSS